MTDKELINAMSTIMDQKLQVLSDSMDQKMDQKLQAFSDSMDQKLQVLSVSMDQKLQALSDSMDQKFETVNHRLDNLERHLELETDKNILIIAEGHLDLNRKLDEALHTTRKIENTHEMTQIRLNILESDVREIKARLSQIA
ncbi:MAG: hypothetical protein ACI4BB_06215 [Coprococcus sp.]